MLENSRVMNIACINDDEYVSDDLRSPDSGDSDKETIVKYDKFRKE